MSIYETVTVKQMRKEFQEMDSAYAADKIHLHGIMNRCYELGAKEEGARIAVLAEALAEVPSDQYGIKRLCLLCKNYSSEDSSACLDCRAYCPSSKSKILNFR